MCEIESPAQNEISAFIEGLGRSFHAGQVLSRYHNWIEMIKYKFIDIDVIIENWVFFYLLLVIENNFKISAIFCTNFILICCN